jgi:Rrf2 family protein
MSQTSRYALKILSYLENHRHQWCGGDHIAAATGIPANYLSKILNQLRKRGFVLSRKGWGGGFQLKEDARSIPIIDVLRVFDGVQGEFDCIFGLGACDDANPCPLHDRWKPVRNAYEAMLHSVTIGDLREKGGVDPG